MAAMDMMTDDVRGSAPVMTTKDLVLELYHDMKAVRPMVEVLGSANLPGRVTMLEQDKIARDARGSERGRLAGITNKTVIVALGLGELLLGIVVAYYANHLHV